MSELTWAEKETIADEVLAERSERFRRSYDIECPKCGMPPGSACRLGGGTFNHSERIVAASGLPKETQ